MFDKNPDLTNNQSSENTGIHFSGCGTASDRQTESHWKCPRCGTLNGGEICVMCNSPKSDLTVDDFYSDDFNEDNIQYVSDEYVPHKLNNSDIELPLIEHRTIKKKPPYMDMPYKRKVSRKGAILAIILSFTLMAVAVGFFSVNYVYDSACSDLEHGNYDGAVRQFSKVSFYKDSKDKILECNYEEAISSLDNEDYQYARSIFVSLGDYKDADTYIMECDYCEGKSYLDMMDYESARKIFETIPDYKDSDDLLNECTYVEAYLLYDDGDYEGARTLFESIIDFEDSNKWISECDYAIAKQYLEDDNYEEAIEMFSSLDGYKDSEGILDDIKDDIYDDAVELYREKLYTSARKKFDMLDGYSRSDDYIVLIDGYEGKADIDDLKKLIGFEDADEILLDGYMGRFMLGRWENYYGDYIEYYYGDDNETQCSYNLPSIGEAHYKLENGIHYAGDGSEYDWTRQWEYTIISEDCVEVYCYRDVSTYTLYRQ